MAPALPGPGLYPVPDHHEKGVVDRRWDGEVWTGEVKPTTATLPAYKRHFLRIFHHGGWKLILAFFVLVGGATALWATGEHNKWVQGAQIAIVPLAFLATLVAVYSLVWRLFGYRTGLDRIPVDIRKDILKWGVIAAVVGFLCAFSVEFVMPKLFGGDGEKAGWMALSGPAEETGKLLVPVILWIKGRFRVPREGYLLVLVTAGAFGVMEGTEYAVSPEIWQPSRPFFELMHPLLTGFVAAVAWQAAWHRNSIFTRAAIGAWIAAMVAHSTNDVVVVAKHASGTVADLSNFITVAMVLLMFLLQKRSARQLVPPDQVGRVSRGWRPAAPRHAEVSA